MSERKILAVDVGKARVGLAISDSGATLATPLSILPRQKFEAEDFSRIKEIVQDEGVGLVLVGYPRSLDGGETKSTVDAMEVAERLASSLHIPVQLYDERLTSKEARRRLAESAGRPPVGRPSRNRGWKRGQRKRHRPAKRIDDDSAAATIFLQSYLDSLKEGD